MIDFQDTDAVETVHIASKDLLCPICCVKYDLLSYQPISLSCGHNICSTCLRRIRNCPLCRRKIHGRASHSKNVLISCILEQKKKVKECKIHARPLEFFCKDHKKLICVDCAIEGNHFSHDFVKCKDVDTRAEKLKNLMKKVDTKDEQCTSKFKLFLEKEKKDLKRRLDEVLDEYLEPLLMIKKKLHKEVDTFILNQNGTYEKDSSREIMLKWKKENESLVSQWESKGEAETAAQIIENHTEEAEEKLNKYENQLKKVQEVTEGNVNLLAKTMRSKISPVKGPWKKLSKKLVEVLGTMKTKTDPRVEKEYLVNFLKEYGIMTIWVEKEGEEILEIKECDKEVKLKESEMKYFDCTLEKLCIKSGNILDGPLRTICKVIERTIKLSDLKLMLMATSDQDMILLEESIKKMKTLEKFNIAITSMVSDNISEKGLGKLLLALTELPKLKALSISLEKCDGVANEGINDLDSIFKKMNTLKDFTLKLIDCDGITNEGITHFLQSLNNLSHLTKFSLMIYECKNLTYKFFTSLCKTLEKLSNLEELNLIFDGFYEMSNPITMISLSNTIPSLTKVQKLGLSFAENVYLPSYVIRKFMDKITGQMPNLKEFSLDLSRCKEIVNATLEGLGMYISRLLQLDKLKLKFRMCSISDKGALALISHIIKLESLKSLTLDFRGCKLIDNSAQEKILEQINKISKVNEKEILFTVTELKEEQQSTELVPFQPHRQATTRGSSLFDMWSDLELISGDDDGRFTVPYNGNRYEPFYELDDDEDFDFGEQDGEDDNWDDDYAMISIHSSDLDME